MNFLNRPHAAGTYVVHFAKALKGGLRPDTTAQQQTADPSATAGAASATGVTVQSSLWSHPGTSSTLSAHGADSITFLTAGKLPS